jgi:hypothetical protein
MQAVILTDQTRVADVPDKSPTTGMALGTVTRKVFIVYSIPEMNMIRTVQVNHPATLTQIQAAVQACAQSCMDLDSSGQTYQTLLTGNNTIEL